MTKTAIYMIFFEEDELTYHRYRAIQHQKINLLWTLCQCNNTWRDYQHRHSNGVNKDNLSHGTHPNYGRLLPQGGDASALCESTIQREYDALIKNGTWGLVDLPKERKQISKMEPPRCASWTAQFMGYVKQRGFFINGEIRNWGK